MEQQMAVINIQAGEVFKANEDIASNLLDNRLAYHFPDYFLTIKKLPFSSSIIGVPNGFS
ncbi:MAG: hypothetical protein CM15mP39_11050 [Synechococcus sp.]|nr:MAG: hypothetical protein CM15mP39_11050 [Synechococcus sp.]